MKINEIVEKYNNNQRIDLAKLLDVKKYIGIEQKAYLAQLVLENCTEVVNNTIKINSLDRYILFTIAVIGMHTNLEFVDEDNTEYSVTDGYDILCESGLLVKIIDTFRDDYAACQEVLNMMTSDIMQNNITIEQKIGLFLDEIKDIASTAVEGLLDQLDLDNMVDGSQIDQGKLLKLFDFISKE